MWLKEEFERLKGLEVELNEYEEQMKQAQDVNNMLDIVIGKMKDDELDDKQYEKLMSFVCKKVKVNTDGLLHFNTKNHDIYAVVCTEFDRTDGILPGKGQLANHTCKLIDCITD